MNQQGESRRAWRKSSYSGSGANCIEVADNFPGFIIVRDSNDADGPKLTFTLTGWVWFMSRLKGN